MKLFRLISALLTASVLFSMFGASSVDAVGRRRGPAVIQSPYYADPYGPGYSVHGNPFVAPLPAYGILPPPLATYQMMYGYDPYQGGRRPDAYANSTDTLDYVPRKRPELYPAIPFGKNPAATEVDIRRARFEITVPTPDAIVIFDGAKTKQTGTNRVFVTPPLEDRLYSSTIEVSWTGEDGAKLTRKKTFEFVAGERLTHRFAE